MEFTVGQAFQIGACLGFAAGVAYMAFWVWLAR